MHYADDHFLFPLVREPRSRWERAGLSPRQERRVSLALNLLVLLFVAGWAYTIVLRLSNPRPVTDGADTPVLGSGSAFEDPNAPPTIAERLGRGGIAPALTAELLRRSARSYAATLDPSVRGFSGAVYAQILEPGEQPDLPAPQPGAEPTLGNEIAGRLGGGISGVVLRAGRLAEPVPNLQVIRMVPMSVKKGGSVGRYKIGNWPCEVGRCPASPIYQTPKGMIEVTPQNKEIFLSEHIQLKDFITKLQENVWPKYVVVDPKNLDKIELVVKELEAMGHPVDNLFAVSGFRSPWYNASGGSTAGRGQLSRHMWGDAMDIAVDNDRNGIMDDLNGDGAINLKDARIIGVAVDRVEQKYPSLVGGMHYYPPTGGHKGMVHIDTRGNRARW
ncbi:MAG TPA: hypothetical protein VF584_01420 [Longimicrobium sp.]|jgi:uncharacterized protein YcbK (DUF882 family)